MLGGFGGAINAAYAHELDGAQHRVDHGHFHLTVGTAVALTFMGGAYWLVPKVSGRALELSCLPKFNPTSGSWAWPSFHSPAMSPG